MEATISDLVRRQTFLAGASRPAQSISDQFDIQGDVGQRRKQVIDLIQTISIAGVALALALHASDKGGNK